MPKAQFFGRTWNFPTDDLVFSSLLLFALRVASLILFGLSLTSEYSKCVDAAFMFKASVLCLTSTSALGLILTFAQMLTSARGGPMEVEKRKAVPYLYVTNLATSVVDSIGFALWCLGGGVDNSNDECNDNVHLWHKIAVSCTLTVALIQAAHFVISYDNLGRIRYKYLNTKKGTYKQKLDARLGEALMKQWSDRLALTGGLRRGGEGKKTVNTSTKTASILSLFFKRCDLTESDLFMGLALLRVQTKEWINSRHHAYASSVKAVSRRWNPTCVQATHNGCFTIDYDAENDPWLDLRRMRDLAKLCCASDKEDDSLLRQFNFADDESVEPKVKKCFFCAGQSELDLATFVSWGQTSIDDLFTSPYYVVVLHEYQIVSVVVRGTMSLNDILVDLNATEITLNEEQLPSGFEGQAVAHGGMYKTASDIYKEIMETRILDYALKRANNYKLTVAGHSLGAGIASLLTILLRKTYPHIKGYAFGCPFGIMNKELAEFTKSFLVSVVYGYDLVSRMSLPTAEDLRLRLIRSLIICNVPKWKVLARSLFHMRLEPLLNDHMLHDLVHLNEDAGHYDEESKSVSHEQRVIQKSHRSLVYYLKQGNENLMSHPDECAYFRLNAANHVTECSHLLLHLIESSNEMDLSSQDSERKDSLASDSGGIRKKLLESQTGSIEQKDIFPIAVWSDVSQLKSILIHEDAFNNHKTHEMVHVLDRLCQRYEAPDSKSLTKGGEFPFGREELAKNVLSTVHWINLLADIAMKLFSMEQIRSEQVSEAMCRIIMVSSGKFEFYTFAMNELSATIQSKVLGSLLINDHSKVRNYLENYLEKVLSSRSFENRFFMSGRSEENLIKDFIEQCNGENTILRRSYFNFLPFLLLHNINGYSGTSFAIASWDAFQLLRRKRTDYGQGWGFCASLLRKALVKETWLLKAEQDLLAQAEDSLQILLYKLACIFFLPESMDLFADENLTNYCCKLLATTRSSIVSHEEFLHYFAHQIRVIPH
ncbi:hypothetical protein Ciccas_011118 [Cichlidogyrus casuarinus]|uniref:sn-1-specific diacylglycerol lipase n=1 Tax=Cichlidogyrus casuarinus TaxID=1844966 RepID=A0ABD2PS66_9PLAT